ncbi:unnamed protein product, partial [Medioppia subpectinata]
AATTGGPTVNTEEALLEKALAMSLETDEERNAGVKPPVSASSAMPNFATMSEEEQIAYAMQMSLQAAHESKPVDSPVPMETDDTEDKSDGKEK